MREAAETRSDRTLLEYWELLGRRKALIFVTTLLFLAAAGVYVFTAPRVFRSTARLLIQNRADAVARRDAGDPFSELYVPPPTPNVATQIEVLQGEELLRGAFRTAGVPEGSVEVKARRIGETDVVEVHVDSQTPKHAESVARVIPKAFVDYTTRNQKAGVSTALGYAQNRLSDANAKLARAELDLQRFRDRSRLANLERQREARLAQTVGLSTEINATRAAIQGLDSQLKQHLQYRASQPKFVNAPVSTTNTAINTVRDQIAALSNQRASLLVLYKPSHAKVQELDAQIRSLEARLKQMPAETTVVTRSPNPVIAEYDDKIAETRSALAAKRAELREAERSSAAATSDLQRYNQLERQESALQRAVEQQRNSVALLTRSVESLSIQNRANLAPAVTITPAGVAEQVAPQTLAILIAAGMAGLLFGVGLALLHGQFDTHVESQVDVNRILGTPVVGHVPLIRQPEQRFLEASSDFPSLESFRVLRMNVETAMERHGLKSLLVTSTVSGEGKSMTASNLAIALALDGKQVILVDADLRAPSVDAEFSLDRKLGLSNVLFGHCGLEYAVQQSHIPGLHVLTAGLQPSNPAELLNARTMRDLHKQLKEFADIVIIDGPPLLGGADAQVLASQADAVLLVVEMGETTKPALAYATDLLRHVEAKVLGVVLNKISDHMHPYGDWNYASQHRSGMRRPSRPAVRLPLPAQREGAPHAGRVAASSTADRIASNKSGWRQIDEDEIVERGVDADVERDMEETV